MINSNIFNGDYIFPPLEYFKLENYDSVFPLNWVNVKKNKRDIHLYFHIPFCKTICSFCYCRKYLYKGDVFEKYYQYLLKVISKLEWFSIKTIYFGGWTPSLLSIDRIWKIVNILKQFNLVKLMQFNFEVMPETIDENYLEWLINLWVNRLTFGIQSFDSNLVRHFGRYQNLDYVFRLLKFLKRFRTYGQINVNVDLINILPWDKFSSLFGGIKYLVENRLIDSINLYNFTTTETVGIKRLNKRLIIKYNGIIDSFLNRFFKKKWFTCYYNNELELNYQIYRRQVFLEDVIWVGLFARGNIFWDKLYFFNFENNYILYKKMLDNSIDFDNIKWFYFNIWGDLRWEKMRYFLYNIAHGIDDRIYFKIFGKSFMDEHKEFLESNIKYLSLNDYIIKLKDISKKAFLNKSFFNYLGLKFDEYRKI